MKCPTCGADIPEGSHKCPVCGSEIPGDPTDSKIPSGSKFWFFAIKIAMTIGAILSLFEIFLLTISKNYSMPFLVLGLGLLLVGYIVMRAFHVDYDQSS